MSEGSVNVKAEHHPRINAGQLWLPCWELATVLLFQGIEQEENPKFVRVALTIIAATIPFQGIYFLIYILLENNAS